MTSTQIGLTGLLASLVLVLVALVLSRWQGVHLTRPELLRAQQGQHGFRKRWRTHRNADPVRVTPPVAQHMSDACSIRRVANRRLVDPLPGVSDVERVWSFQPAGRWRKAAVQIQPRQERDAGG